MIIKVHVPLKTLSKVASEANYRLVLDEEKCKAAAKNGVPEVIRGQGKASEGSIAPFEIADGADLGLSLPFRPFESIYAAYGVKLPFKRTDTVRENLFQDAVFPVGAATTEELEPGDPFPPVNHPFCGIHRLKLLHLIFEGDSGDTCGLHFDALVASKEIIAHFPLHDRQEKRDLKKAWLSLAVMPWRQPNDLVRAYFGEHVAMYFKFVAYYATAVAVAAVAGVGVSIHVAVQVRGGTRHASPSSLSLTHVGVSIHVFRCAATRRLAPSTRCPAVPMPCRAVPCPAVLSLPTDPHPHPHPTPSPSRHGLTRTLQASKDGNLYHALQTVYSVPAFCVFVAVWSRGLVDHWAQSQSLQVRPHIAHNM